MAKSMMTGTVPSSVPQYQFVSFSLSIKRAIPSYVSSVASRLQAISPSPLRDWVDQPGFSSDGGHEQVLDGSEQMVAAAAISYAARTVHIFGT